MKENKQQEKLSYEQLEGIAHQLSDQVRKMNGQIKEMNISNVMARIGILFKVLDNKDCFSTEFVQMCVDEIEDLIVIPEDENTSSELKSQEE